jgi:hypothetical protein
MLKDPYPLPRIDQIVDSTSGCALLSFLDAYSGFHQIRMAKEDRKHTAFVTVDGLYYYVVMPYGLRNALPTFVRAMSKTFGDLILDNVEIYVDNIVVKSREGSTIVEDLALVFGKLRATCTKLNRRNASLVSPQGSCWGSWFHTGALKLTQRKSRLLR